MKLSTLIGRLRPRKAVAELLQLSGFAVLVCGVLLLLGLGAALVAAGVLLVLLAFEVER